MTSPPPKEPSEASEALLAFLILVRVALGLHTRFVFCSDGGSSIFGNQCHRLISLTIAMFTAVQLLRFDPSSTTSILPSHLTLI